VVARAPESNAGWPSGQGDRARLAFRVQSDGDRGRAVLWLAGELDVTEAGLMADALSAARPLPGQGLVVDLSHCEYIDANGVRLLFAADRRLRDEGRAGLAVRGAAGVVGRIFEILRATSLLEDREPVALAPLGTPPSAERLDRARQAAGLSVADVYVAYFALGGTAELSQVAAHLAGDPYALDTHQRQMVVHAVNEHLIDRERTDQLLSSPSE
jgi:anti-anti-sigma factor